MISKNQIKQIKSLHQKKGRELAQLFLAEGVKTVSELIQHSPAKIKELYAIAQFIKTNKQLLDNSGIKAVEISESDLAQISTQATPNMVLAVCSYFENNHLDFNFEDNYSLYLDGIRDPGNFGTIIRLADWYGIATVFCSPDSCELYNPKVIQSTMGAFMRVKVVYASLNGMISKNKISNIYGAVLNGKNVYMEKLSNGLLIIGNEANGISAENLKLINHHITIPSHQNNGTESLNAAMAASIITSEFFRQLKN